MVFRTFTVWTLCVFAGTFAILVSACSKPQDTANDSNTPPSVTTMFSESESYERFMGRWSRQLATPFLRFSGLKERDSVLDVGSGTGALAEVVLSNLGSVTVIGVDPAEPYVEYARNRVVDPRATFEVGDGQNLRFDNESFDATLSLLVINFIPDAHKAVDEMTRVTRTGGVVAAAVWDYGKGMEMLRVFWDAVVSLDPSAEPRDERHMPFCTSEELGDLWREHGLVDVQVEPLDISTEFASFEEFWSPFLEKQGPAGAYVASLNSDDQTKLKERLRKRLSSAGAGEKIVLTARAWAVKGVVPAR